MAQIAKIVDLTKSYLPIDPQAFAQNLSYTAQEDNPEKGLPIIAFEGYNFLPTSYGYRSYFGTSTELTLDALPTLCDRIVVMQSKTYENMLIAFCSDGIYTARSGSNSWTQILALTDTWTVSGIYSQYTFDIIENTMYIYRQGHSHVLRIKDDFVHDTFVPSFLNMAGQMGIFRANGRLAFWDSEDSVAWSSAFDLTDFTPSIENLVGNATFFGVLGRIVTVVPHGEGYIIYATKSVVGVSYSGTSTNVWDAMVITSISGIAHPRTVCIGSTIKEHFVYTTNGIAKVGHFNALSRQYEVEYILPELYDFLKEAREPVAITCHAARYLHFCVINSDYINGRTMFEKVGVPTLVAPPITVDSSLFDDIEINTTLEGLSGKSSYQILYNYLRNPNTDVPEEMAGEVIWTACIQLPRINTAVTFTPDKNFTKSVVPATFVSVVDAADNVTTLFNGSAFVAGTQDLSDLIYEYFDFLFPIDSNNDIVSFPYMQSYEPSIYSDIRSKNMFEFLFKWFGSIDQLADQCEAYHQQRIADFASLAPIEIVWYSASHITVSQIAYSDFQSIYIPKRSSHVLMSIDDVAKTMHFSSQMHQYYKHTLSMSASFTSEFSAEVPYYSVDIFKTGQVGAWSFNLVQPSYPTLGDIQAKLTDAPWFDAGTGRYWNIFIVNSTNKYDCTIEDRYVMLDGYANDLIPIILFDGVNYIKADIKIEYMYKNADKQRTYVPGYVQDAALYENLYCIVDDDSATDPWNWAYLGNGKVTVGPINRVYTSDEFLLNNAMLFSSYAQNLPNYSTTYPDYTYPYWAYATSKLTWKYYQYRFESVSVFTHEAYDNKLGEYRNCVLVGDTTTSSAVLDYKNTVTLTPVINTVAHTEAESGSNHGDMCTMNALFTYRGYEGHPTFGVDLSSITDPQIDNFNDYDWPVVSNPNITFDYTALPAYYGTLPITCDRWTIYYHSTGYDQAVVGTSFMNHTNGTIINVPSVTGAIPLVAEVPSCGITYGSGYNLDDINADGFFTAAIDFTYPEATYQIQDGVPIPGYPTYTGSIVFDLHLKKWGKQKNDFKALVEFSPLNSTDNAIIPYTNFGMDSGTLKENRKLSLFSVVPASSMMRYGKFGLYRLGFTEALEFVLHFRTKSTGTLVVDGSVDGRDPELSIQHTETFTDARSHVVKCHVNAVWHTLTISGQFDLQFMEFRGIIAARR